YVFRAPYVEPVWTVGYLGQRPGPRAGHGLYLCTTAQAYPRVTAWNTSVALAREAVAAVCQDLGTTSAGGVWCRRPAESRRRAWARGGWRAPGVPRGARRG